MKFKNVKKKAKNPKSPSNSRTITEQLKSYLPKFSSTTFIKMYRISLKAFVVFIFIVAVIIVGLDFQKNLKVKQEIDSQREVMFQDLNFWEDFISKHQNYRDAYFQASVLEYKLGDTSKAKMYAEKGLALDPNSEDGRKIKAFLNK